MTDPIMSTVLTAAALLIAAGGFIWLSRWRSHRRHAALDAYADREIARTRAAQLRSARLRAARRLVHRRP